MPSRDKPLAIVGGGPSAAELLDEIRSFPGQVLAINGAYDWLQDQGRVADFVALSDPQDGMGVFVRRPHERTKFLIATCCDPSVFDALSSSDVMTWFCIQGKDEPGPYGVPGGSTCLTRSPLLAVLLGYREIVIYGADSSYTDKSHAYESSISADAFTVVCEREWLTSMQMLAQAEYLAEMIPTMRQAVKIDLKGEHLASALLRTRAWSVK